MLPGMIGYILGRLADKTADKARWKMLSNVFQGLLYLLLTVVIDEHYVGVFYLVVLINIVSDCIGLYSSSLSDPIIQNRVPKTLHRQTLGFMQSVSLLLQPLGQSLGLVILNVFHSYRLAGLINALTFFMSAACLFVFRKHVAFSTAHRREEKSQVLKKEGEKNIFKLVGKITETAAGLNAFYYVSILGIINLILSGETTLVNLFFMDAEKRYAIGFGTLIFIVTTVYMIGMVLGGMLQTEFTARLSLRFYLVLVTSCTLLNFFNLWLWGNLWLVYLTMFIGAFGTGQINPKFSSQVMAIADPDILGTVSALISSVVTFVSPIGGVFLVILYNSYSPEVAYTVGIAFLFLALGLIFWTKIQEHSKKKGLKAL